MKIMCFRRSLLVFATVAIFAQCRHGDEVNTFRREIPIEFEVLGEELLYAPSCIKVTDEQIVVSGFSRNSGETFYVYDKSGNLLRSGIYYGRGPAETMSGYMRMNLYDGIVSYDDILLGDRMSFTLEDFLKEETFEVSREMMEVPSWCVYASQTPKGEEVRIISRSRTKDLDLPQRTIIVGDTEGEHVEFNEPAFEDRDISFFATLQIAVDYSPDGSKMILSSYPGMTIEILSLEDPISRTSMRRLLPPSVTVGKSGLDLNDDYVYGGGKLCTTDNFIYSAYDGETTSKDLRLNGDKCLLYKNVAVFDWEGSPQTLYKTDYRVACLCVENDSTLYAVIEDIEGKAFIGKAKLHRK